MESVGVVLVNVGTPEAPTAQALRPYLKEFLSDPYVIDIPAPIRWFLVNAVIVPFRAGLSAKMYQEIWTEEGSPLMRHTRSLAAKVEKRLPASWNVEVAMRYGNPSMESVLRAMVDRGVRRIVVSPQYPQYALATVESTIQEAERCFRAIDPKVERFYTPDFFDDPGFLGASAAGMQEVLSAFPADYVLMSFHGVPVRQLIKASGPGCANNAACCARLSDGNARCYRAQCLATARDLAQRLGLDGDGYSASFQSKVGPSEWAGPYTDEVIVGLAQKGVKRLAVACPSFTADCLETLEEVARRYGEQFREAGGEELRLIPCVNDRDDWANALAGLIQSKSGVMEAQHV